MYIIDTNHSLDQFRGFKRYIKYISDTKRMNAKGLNFWRFGAVILVITFFSKCSDDDSEPVLETGNVTFRFEHQIEGEPIDFDNMIYTNEAGNPYEVSEIQWFISDITLTRCCGVSYVLDDSEFAHYVDTDIPESWEWIKTDTVPANEYESIIITFGLKGEENTPLTFVNPPESDMIWPYPMGGDNGGYHYMKLNGFWKDQLNERQAFNFHMGVGKVVDDNESVEFVQNWFEVELANSSFSLSNGETKEITIVMNVEEWFKNPNVYDHNVFGGKIMNNQDAMYQGCENGKKGVFTIGSIE